eukprot:SAG11_NODE_180_length_13278_cov_9.158434_14_plen_314_part_00
MMAPVPWAKGPSSSFKLDCSVKMKRSTLRRLTTKCPAAPSPARTPSRPGRHLKRKDSPRQPRRRAARRTIVNADRRPRRRSLDPREGNDKNKAGFASSLDDQDPDQDHGQTDSHSSSIMHDLTRHDELESALETLEDMIVAQAARRAQLRKAVRALAAEHCEASVGAQRDSPRQPATSPRQVVRRCISEEPVPDFVGRLVPPKATVSSRVTHPHWTPAGVQPARRVISRTHRSTIVAELPVVSRGARAQSKQARASRGEPPASARNTAEHLKDKAQAQREPEERRMMVPRSEPLPPQQPDSAPSANTFDFDSD